MWLRYGGNFISPFPISVNPYLLSSLLISPFLTQKDHHKLIGLKFFYFHSESENPKLQTRMQYQDYYHSCCWRRKGRCNHLKLLQESIIRYSFSFKPLNLDQNSLVGGGEIFKLMEIEDKSIIHLLNILCKNYAFLNG